jgi:hypothetical protein
MLVGTLATASWAASSSKVVNADRWARSVCGGVSTWVDQRTAMDAQVQGILADLGAGKVQAVAAKKRLALAYSKAAAASDALVTSVKATGAPQIPSGRALAIQYAGTLSSYADAYRTARTTFANVKAKSGEEIIAAAQQVNTKLAADLAVVGADPIEELRPVTELAEALAASCANIETYLVKAIDAPCRAAIDAAQVVLDAQNRFQAAAAGSAEEDAADSAFDAASDNLRSALGACNVPGVVAVGCRTVLQTAQAFADAEGRFLASAVDSPEETTANNDMSADLVQLQGQVPKCPKG